MKIGLFIVGYKGLLFLKGLKANPSFVVTYGDSGTIDEHHLGIIDYCKSNQIECIDRTSIRDNIFNEVDKIFVIGWQYLFKEDLDKIVIFHDSKLPELRGWCPTPTSLICGIDHLGATAFQPTADVDWGRVYDSQSRNISYPLKLKDAIDITIDMYLDMANKIIDGDVSALDFPSGVSTYSMWRDREDMFIDWGKSCISIKRKVDALGYPLDGALTTYGGKDIRVIDVEIVKEPYPFIDRYEGKIFSMKNNIPLVICGKDTNDGAVKIIEAYYDGTNDPVKFKRLKDRVR